MNNPGNINSGNPLVFGFYYNSCIFESSADLVSLHVTKSGAYRAMNKYITDLYYQSMEVHHGLRKMNKEIARDLVDRGVCSQQEAFRDTSYRGRHDPYAKWFVKPVELHLD
jgi:hypothetical protein